MPIGLSTSCARAGSPSGSRLAPDALLDRVLRAGASGMLLDDSLPPGYLAELRPSLAARRGEVGVWAVENVCPASRRAAAELGSLDRDEAAAAVEAATESVRLAAELGESSDGHAPLVLLRLGEVTGVRGRWPPVRRAFLRDELDDTVSRARLLRERDAHAARHLDVLRRSLDRLGRLAESAGVRLGLRNPARIIGLPSPVELKVLLDDLHGAPVAPALDLCAAHLGDAMGLRTVDEVLAVWKSSPLALVADACGAVFGLAPGQGELDVARVVAALDPAARLCFVPSPILDEREVIEGALTVAALPRPALAQPASDAAR